MSPATAAKSTEAPPAPLADAQARFIALWGEMASRWGVPRTMAETHALLLASGEALDAEEVVRRLRISRGNASMTLRTLVEWGVVSRVLRPGERRERFAAEQDPWRLFATVIEVRKRREVDPLLEGLERCRAELPADAGDADGRKRAKEHNARIDDLLEGVRLLDELSTRFLGGGGGALRTAASLFLKLPAPGGRRLTRRGTR